MRVYSFIDNDFELMKAEIDVSLMAGLPDLKIIGLPDSAIKESGIRIKSALKNQGFHWPKKHQILVHIKPNNLKKKSQGLDLAIAAGILAETKQLELKTNTFYGELGLKGDVMAPSDISDVQSKEAFCTGVCKNLRFDSLQIKNLSDITHPDFIKVKSNDFSFNRPELPSFLISKLQFEVCSVIATGEHNALFVGSPGTGKTTSCDIISRSLLDPARDVFFEARSIWRRLGKNLTWRPIECPHHTGSHIAVIGGGTPIGPGAVTRAHGGVLILDELLEFSNSVQESLREPLERGKVYLARSNGMREMPASFLFLATTNLCRCGKYLPHDSRRCICSSYRLQKYLDKISGPVFDRFQIIYIADNFAGSQDIHSGEIYQVVQKARKFAVKSRGQVKPNGKLSAPDTFKLDPENKFDIHFPELATQNRTKLAILQVARTLADIASSERIKPEFLHKAHKLSYETLYRIQNPVF